MDDKSELMSEAGNPARGCVWGWIFSIPLDVGLYFLVRWLITAVR